MCTFVCILEIDYLMKEVLRKSIQVTIQTQNIHVTIQIQGRSSLLLQERAHYPRPLYGVILNSDCVIFIASLDLLNCQSHYININRICLARALNGT